MDWVWKVGGLDFWLRVCDLGLPDRAGAGRMAGCRPWASGGRLLAACCSALCVALLCGTWWAGQDLPSEGREAGSVSWGWDSVGRFLERWYLLALLAQVGRWASAGSM